MSKGHTWFEIYTRHFRFLKYVFSQWSVSELRDYYRTFDRNPHPARRNACREVAIERVLLQKRVA